MLGFLYESFPALGTGDLKLPFAFWDTQSVSAAGALDESVCLSVFKIR